MSQNHKSVHPHSEHENKNISNLSVFSSACILPSAHLVLQFKHVSLNAGPKFLNIFFLRWLFCSAIKHNAAFGDAYKNYVHSVKAYVSLLSTQLPHLDIIELAGVCNDVFITFIDFNVCKSETLAPVDYEC